MNDYFELPSDCKGDGYDIALASHSDDKLSFENQPGKIIIREKIYLNGTFCGYHTYELPNVAQVGEREALGLPVGSLVSFERWQACCYYTKYYSTRTYRVQLTKRGAKPFLKLIDSGSYRGHSFNSKWHGRVLRIGGAA